MDNFSRISRFIQGELTPGQRRGAIVLALALFVAAIILYLRSAPSVPVEVKRLDLKPAGGDRSARAHAVPPREVVVHISGAVSKPGVYRLPEGARVDEVVRAAGGPLPSGLVHELNLAARVIDGQKIVVPAVVKASVGSGGAGSQGSSTRGARDPVATQRVSGSGGGETGAVESGGNANLSAGSEDAGGQPIDLNTATAEQLDALPGVGPAIAKRILEYRESHERFRTAAELQQVKGIGPKKYQELKGKVSAGP